MDEVAEGEEKGFGAALVAEKGKLFNLSCLAALAVLLFFQRFRVVVRGCEERVGMGRGNGVDASLC